MCSVQTDSGADLSVSHGSARRDESRRAGAQPKLHPYSWNASHVDRFYRGSESRHAKTSGSPDRASETFRCSYNTTVALHPNFRHNSWVYRFWTESSTGAFQADADQPERGNDDAMWVHIGKTDGWLWL